MQGLRFVHIDDLYRIDMLNMVSKAKRECVFSPCPCHGGLRWRLLNLADLATIERDALCFGGLLYLGRAGFVI